MLKVAHLTIRYGNVTALDDVSLEIRKGERVMICGPNGAGKSTLVSAMVQPGESMLVPQLLPQGVRLKVRDYVMLGRTPFLKAFSRPSKDDVQAVDRAMSATGVTSLEDRFTDTLSGGELQCASVAMALAGEARTMLFDEPASHLDLGRRRTLFELLNRLAVTCVVVQHELPVEEDFFTRAVVLSQGKVVADGSPSKVLTPSLISSIWGITPQQHLVWN